VSFALYNLASDPKEMVSVSEENAQTVSDMNMSLEALKGQLPILETAFTEAEVDPEVEDQLRAMGYLE
jgi:hypothetical protein